MYVAPFVGAWIEIARPTSSCVGLMSLRSSERGLKSDGVYTPEHVDASLRSSERGLKSYKKID